MGDFDEFDRLGQLIRNGTEGFYHTTPIITYDPNFSVMEKMRYGETERVREGATSPDFINAARTPEGGFQIDLRTAYLLGIAAGVNVLTTSTTGEGKTQLMRGIGQALFGNDYCSIQIDPGTRIEQFVNVNFAKMKKGEGTLADAMEPAKGLTTPFLIMDELNRAPDAVLNGFINLVEKGVITLEGGRTLSPGVYVKDGVKVGDASGSPVEGASLYQVKLATANLGAEYTGTFKLDRAMLERFHIWLDLDLYPANKIDAEQISRNGGYSLPTTVPNAATTAEVLRLIFSLNEKIRRIQIDPEVAEPLLGYLKRLNQCYESPDGLKTKMPSFNAGSTCTGCPASMFSSSKAGGICGNVYAISSRAQGAVVMMMKAFAAYRRHILPGSPQNATIQDLFGIAPLVLPGKLVINPAWVGENADGSVNRATSKVLKIINARWVNSTNMLMDSGLDKRLVLLARHEGKDLSTAECMDLNRILTIDPWSAEGVPEVRLMYDNIQAVTNGKGSRALPESIRGKSTV